MDALSRVCSRVTSSTYSEADQMIRPCAARAVIGQRARVLAGKRRAPGDSASTGSAAGGLVGGSGQHVGDLPEPRCCGRRGSGTARPPS